MDSSGELKKLVNLSKWQIFFQVFLVAALVVWPVAALISFSLPSVGLSDAAFLIIGITLGATIIFVFALIRWAIREVPTVHYGVVLFLKKRTERELGEGWHWIIPGFNSVELFSLEVKTMPIKVSFFSKDRLEVVAKGSLQWRPDKHHLRETFIEMDEKTIVDGLGDAVNGELGVIGGTKDAGVFIEKREAVSFLMNCVLRLSTPPHAEKALSPAKRLAYYVKNAIEIGKRLDDEVNHADDRSHVERLYGIDVVKFALADVDFSPETRKAMELKKQTAEKLKADELQADYVIATIERLKAAGLTPMEAKNTALAVIGEGESKAFSFEGLNNLKLGI